MACPVCFGGEDTLMRESLNTGIGVLMGVTAVVLAFFARFIFKLVKRSREAVGSHLLRTLSPHLSMVSSTNARPHPDLAGTPRCRVRACR